MELTFEMVVVMVVGACAVVLFIREIFTPDITALLAIVVVLLTGVARPEWALVGFANPAVHTVAAMFVISAGLIRTGAVERAGRRFIQLGGQSPKLVLFLMLLIVLTLSAFLNNTPIVVMMIPIALQISEVHHVLPSKLLIPISYASIFGGACTLIGTSTNLVVSGMAAEAGFAPIGMFELAPVGLILAALGMTYLMFVAPRLLPNRQTATTNLGSGPIREYLTELVIRPDSSLIGQPLEETPLTADGRLRVVEVIRDEEILWPPLGRIVLREGDILLARGSATEIVAAGSRSGVEVVPELEPESVKIDAITQLLAEIVIPPGSRFEGASIPEIGFRQHFGISVLAIQRHGRHHIREKLSSMRIRQGDVVLIQGSVEAVEALRTEDGVILLEGVESSVTHHDRAPIAVGILIMVIAGATFTPIPVVAFALAGAVLMMLTRCLSARQFYRSLDVRTLVLIAGMIGLGRTAQETGATAFVAHHVFALAQPLGPVFVLAAIYLITNLLTEFLSNAAAAVLVVPLAISTAQELGVSERPFLVAVAFAASAAFSTPVGYQTNTIVYGPGGYRFIDYTKVGLPLNVVFLFVATLLIPVFWPF